MEPAAVRAELARDRVDERREVVVGLLLDLRDAGGRGRSARSARIASCGLGRHDADLGPAVERGELDFQPALELALVRPDPGHGRAGVAGDH